MRANKFRAAYAAARRAYHGDKQDFEAAMDELSSEASNPQWSLVEYASEHDFPPLNKARAAYWTTRWLFPTPARGRRAK
jgi:hypothetical protein